MDNRSLARLTIRNLFWAFLATGSGKLLSLAGVALLARVLAPEDFGLLAIGLLFVTYVDTLGDLGTGAALIAWRERKADAAQVTFYVNLAAGALWFVSIWCAAPLAAVLFDHAEVTPVLRALAWTFPLRALGNTHDALARKTMKFRARSVPEIGMVVVRLGVSIPLALTGQGVWSLVWGQLAGAAVWTLLLWTIVDWRPRANLPIPLLMPMLSYGRGIVAVNVLASLVHHFDLVVVGGILGVTELGFYQMAQKFPEATITLATWTTGRVLFPAFSLIQTDAELLRRSYLATLRYVSLLVLPVATCFVVFADSIVVLGLGEAWGPSAPILRGLAVAAAIRAIGSPAGDVLKATGRSSLLAKLGLVKALLMLPAVTLAARFGGPTVAWCVAGTTLATSSLNVVVAARIVGARSAELIGALRPVSEPVGAKP